MTQETPLRHQYTELHQIFIDKSISENDYKQKLTEIIKPENFDEIKKLDLIENFITNNDLHTLEILKEVVVKQFPNTVERANKFKELLNLKVTLSKIGRLITKETLIFLVEEYGFNPEKKDNYGATILHYAAMYNNMKIVKFLVKECKIDVNIKDKLDETMLHHAAITNSITMVKFLVKECNAHVNAKNKWDETILHCAAITNNITMVKFLVKECNAHVNAKTKSDDTILHYAARYGYLETVRFLVEECNLNINAEDEYGRTILHHAVRHSGLHVVKYLVSCKNIDLKARDRSNKTALDVAKQIGNIKVVNFLTSITQVNGYRKLLSNFISPIAITLAAPYIKLYSLTLVFVVGFMDYVFNGKKAESVMLNSILELATYVGCAVLAGILGLNTDATSTINLVSLLSTYLNVSVNMADECVLKIDNSLRDDWVESLRQKEAEQSQEINRNR